MKKLIENVKFRAWLYGIGIAVGALLVTLGIVGQDVVDSIMGVLTAILGVTAVTHLPKASQDDNIE